MDFSVEVDEFIKKIENKYAQEEHSTSKSNLEDQLQLLSEEFDTLGFPLLEVKQSNTKLLEQIIRHSLLLIQVHRKTLSHIADMNLSNRQKDTKTGDLQNTIQNLKAKIKQTETENNKMEQTIKRLKDECTALKEIISSYKKEIERTKKSCKSKENELAHNINSLKQENERLKDICGQNIEKRFNKEEHLLTVLRQHKQKEETYKCALQKLEENNAEIMNEILNLRTELAVMYSKDNEETELNT